MKESNKRSIVKGATWRIIGTIDTIILSFIFTGHIGKALSIGGIELFTKIFLFWVHERIWLSTKLGRKLVIKDGHEVWEDKHLRSLAKGISWRAVGSLDTFWIALFVNHGVEHATGIALMIAGTEVITKVLLFWLHERVWLNIKWGTTE